MSGRPGTRYFVVAIMLAIPMIHDGTNTDLRREYHIVVLGAGNSIA